MAPDTPQTSTERHHPEQPDEDELGTNGNGSNQAVPVKAIIDLLISIDARLRAVENREPVIAAQGPATDVSVRLPATGRIKLIPPEKFKGERNPRDSVKVRNWVRSYESYMVKALVPIHEYARHLDQFLTEDATNWYWNELTQSNRDGSWEKLKELMMRRFSPPNEELDSFSKFRNFKMRDNAKSYATRFSELLQPVVGDFSDKVIMNFFIDGLHDEIKATVLSRGHKDLASAKEDAIACWDGIRQVQAATGKKQLKHSWTNRSEAKEKSEDKKKEPDQQDGSKKPQGNGPKCYNCHRFGHKSDTCPKAAGNGKS